jgi:hypothetical protein
MLIKTSDLLGGLCGSESFCLLTTFYHHRFSSATMPRLTTPSVKTSVDVEFKTFAYYRGTVSFGSGVMTTCE